MAVSRRFRYVFHCDRYFHTGLGFKEIAEDVCSEINQFISHEGFPICIQLESCFLLPLANHCTKSEHLAPRCFHRVKRVVKKKNAPIEPSEILENFERLLYPHLSFPRLFGFHLILSPPERGIFTIWQSRQKRSPNWWTTCFGGR